jgi:hypothetical protein
MDSSWTPQTFRESRDALRLRWGLGRALTGALADRQMHIVDAETVHRLPDGRTVRHGAKTSRASQKCLRTRQTRRRGSSH